ncbi:type I restriction-modification enzyme R subunit C-terminal domain-containing protein [Candidatus Chloroploca sp. Khr17]|uniref:type I restriction-modification enzyme R subunit C-terminal domain-containing protein n=1 Tax=Candidatus Chloroploca sp. Khr17 TaxID=2496869 RepID=UPI00101CDD6E|nr:type I restriction-modification enzyme R subunit C-terminal domain-containing protein [Candidatus Chloroploca sp. Khr17]
MDAVGVTEGKKNASQPLERNHHVSFAKLIDQVAQDRRDDDGLSRLAGRLAMLDRKLDDDDRVRVAQQTGGPPLCDLAHALLDALDPDKHEALAKAQYGPAFREAERDAVAEQLAGIACARFDDAKLRQLLKDIKQKSDIVLVRFALGLDQILEPFSAKVEQRFNLWIGREKNQGREYTPAQIEWLRAIASYIAANAEIGPRDLICRWHG